MDQGEVQQRRVPGYPFAAPATVIPESGTPVGGNVTELSLYGCYLDSTAPLNPRSRVLLKIYSPNGEYFEASATVIYSNPSLGMGLVFRLAKPHYLTTLTKWLLGAMQETQAEKQRARAEEPEENPEEISN
jgi:PilZ domain